MSEAAEQVEVDPILEAMRPETTGDLIVVFKKGASVEDRKLIMTELAQSSSVMRGASVAVTDGAEHVAPGDVAEIEIFRHVGAAIVRNRGGAGNVAAMQESLEQTGGIASVREEYYQYALDASFTDTSSATWGLEATGVLQTDLTGAGIKVAVLDTGIDLGHPDFIQRQIHHKSFVFGETVQDVHGHGTHCAGTVAGPRVAGPGAVPGYGCAPGVDLFIGKVLNDRGFGRDGDIIAGIDWAIDNGCDIVSMSLGSPTMRGQRYDDTYESIALDALEDNCLIIAAAGNDSNRLSGRIAPVSKPANSPSILSVGAVDPSLQIANFSNGGMNGDGGAVDITAPGVAVFSAAPTPRLYRTLDGTSMACPHVAGVAALWAELSPEFRGQKLWDVIVGSARKIDGLPRDFGKGLVRAPDRNVS